MLPFFNVLKKPLSHWCFSLITVKPCLGFQGFNLKTNYEILNNTYSASNTVANNR